MIVSDEITSDSIIEVHKTSADRFFYCVGQIRLANSIYMHNRCIPIGVIGDKIDLILNIMETDSVEIVTFNRQVECSLLTLFEKKFLIVPDNISNEKYLELLLVFS